MVPNTAGPEDYISWASRSNIAVESWFMNRFRGGQRFAALCSTIEALLPTLQQLRDKLVVRGVFKTLRTVKGISTASPIAEHWSLNAFDPLELALLDPDRAHRLRQHFDANLLACKHDNVNTCRNCPLKQKTVERAERAERIVKKQQLVATAPAKPPPSQPSIDSTIPPSPPISVGTICAGIHALEDAPDKLKSWFVTSRADYSTVACGYGLCTRKGSVKRGDGGSDFTT